jgi:hypothetical protein
MLLIRPLASAGFEDKIGSSFLAERVVAEEGDNARPLRDDRLSFVAFPALVNLSQSAELPRYILLTQIQQQPSTAKMLPKSPWLGDDAFLSENECFKRIVAHQDREKAKWQNRVIPFLANSQVPERRLASERDGEMLLRLV